MDINQDTLEAIFTGLSTAFNVEVANVETAYQQVAMTVPSTTAMNAYPRLDELPGIRRWDGDRVVHGVGANSTVIENEEFELTIGIKRSRIRDDQIGLFTPIAASFGRKTAAFPDSLVFPLMNNGENNIGPDGQNFFDTDHPGWNEEGQEASVSNYAPGANPAWYLVDDSQVFMPLIFQDREKFTLTARDDPKDEGVWSRGQFEWGIDGRCAAGYGSWQLIYKSKEALTIESYKAARAAMHSIRKRSGEVSDIKTKKLLVPNVLEEEGKKVVEAALIDGGNSNIWVNSASLSVIPQLG
ncbi:MAG: hypothetical protein COB78_05730 [Hyphomicrobiales bacterium]|nr:MAG: hypothetical protein COB78_05730 [Hyphomicrobiales bacterium]